MPADSHPLHALYSHHHGWLQAWLRRRLGCAQDAYALRFGVAP
jgi:RNA polymerase sigma-70 factor (ECF subfamily)